ncbi:MAG TPA: hypothetical protein VK795_01795 [Terriglobales bacterium]|nr:hypothetical protein [Terriglobales bacterium]
MNTLQKITAIAIAAVVVLISIELYPTRAAAPPVQVWSPGCVSSVPKAWGQFKGGSAQTGLAFEDSAGTLRFVTNVPCGATPLVALEVRRSTGNASGDAGH